MDELPGFTKEERLFFGLHIIELERKHKEKATTRQTESFLKKKEKLKKERLDFLVSLEK